jgi:hypothetical protein
MTGLEQFVTIVVGMSAIIAGVAKAALWSKSWLRERHVTPKAVVRRTPAEGPPGSQNPRQSPSNQRSLASKSKAIVIEAAAVERTLGSILPQLSNLGLDRETVLFSLSTFRDNGLVTFEDPLTEDSVLRLVRK